MATAKRKLDERTCEICGAAFTCRPESRTATCSPACGYELRSRKARAKSPLPPKGRDTGERIVYSGNEGVIEAPRSRIHTLEQLVEYFEIDLDVWEVVDLIANKWEVGAKNADNELVVEPLYQVKARLRRKVKKLAVEEEIERLKAKMLEGLDRKPPKVVRSLGDPTSLMGEIVLTDMHFGALAWPRETGGAAYDTAEASRRFRLAGQHALGRLRALRVDEIWIPLGNDLLHADNQEATTTRGTRMDVDTRFPKMYEAAFDANVWLIEQARKVARNVRVILVRGNHAELGEWTLAHALRCWFRQYDDVEIDHEPEWRKARRWGDVGFVFGHGHNENRRKLPLYSIREFARELDGARLIEIHTGDLHQRRLEEEAGVCVRIMPTLKPPDGWHAKKQYVGNVPQSETYVWHRERGLVAMYPYTHLEG